MNNVLNQFFTATSSCISREGKAMYKLSSTAVTIRKLFYAFFFLISISGHAATYTYYDTDFGLTVPATSNGNHTATFNWLPLFIGHYYLQERLNGGSWNTVYTKSMSADPTYSVSLSNRATGNYTYRVKAVLHNGTMTHYGINKTVIVSASPGVPSSIAVAPDTVNGDTFTVNWGVASGIVNTYELEQQFNGGGWSSVYSGTGTSQTYSGFADGSYSFRIKACNNEGCSAYRVIANPYVVTSPISSTTSAIHSIRKSHKIDWAASSGNFDAYQLYSKFNDDNWSLVYEGLDLSVTFTNLADGHYQYWVRACNTGGSITTCSDYQASDRLTLSYVDTPTDLIVPTGDADGVYTISWQPGQGAATTYTLQEQVNSGAWTTLQDTADTSYIASGKTNNQYSYQIRACNTGGCTDYSVAQSVNVLLAGQPGPITGPSNLQEVDDFALAWGTASGTVTHYELEEQTEGGSWNPTYSGTDLTKAFTDHDFGTYNYRVRACNDVGCGSYTADKTLSITFTVPPQDPPTPFDVDSNLASLVSQAEIDSTDTVGSVGGSFRVDESGAATYSVPIATVKGTAGVVPQISLNYSSQAGNGLVGKGWSIGGLSAVTRCRQTLSQDKSAKAITWSADDRFCLDGQRLLVDGGANYGDVGASYKTEIDSFAKVTSFGGSDGHPDYFEVERKDGSTSTYGGTGDIDAEQVARNSSGGTTTKTLTWALDRFEDSVGNKIEFDYLDDDDGHRIDRIKYAYGPIDSTNHNAHIDFIYDDEDRDDVISGYVAGYEFKNTQLLKTIKSYNGTNTVRQYNLVYADVSSSNNKTSRLNSLEECVAGDCLPKTDFTWSMPQLTFGSGSSTNLAAGGRRDLGVGNFKPADINGDGNMDLVWFYHLLDGSSDVDFVLRYALSNGTKLTTANFSARYNHDAGLKFEIIDYNGDGRDDVIIKNGDVGNWLVHLSKPQSNGTWALADINNTIDTGISDKNTIFTDVNSDGLVDALYRVQGMIDGNDVLTYYRRLMVTDTTQGAGSSKPYKFGNASVLGTYDASADDTSLLLLNGSKHSIATTGDFNGDGQSDLYIKDAPGIFYVGGHRHVYRTLVTDGSSSSSFHLEANGATDIIKEARFADINGDGLADNVSYYTNGTAGWYIRLSKGTSFETKVRVTGITGNGSTRSSVQLVDINNDGHPDFVWHDKTAKQMKARIWNVASNNFTATINLRSTDGDDTRARLFLDMTGDGVLDYVLFKNDTLYTYPGNTTDDVTYLVTNITNGLGAETEITYTSLADDNHYQTWGYNEPDSIFGIYNKTSSSAFYTALKNAWNPTLPSGSQTLNILSPVLEFSAPTQVVARVDSSAPKAGGSPGAINTSAMSAISYYYGEARLQAAGRGFLGFERIKTKDEQTGVETTTTYRQDWPFIGHPLKTEVRTAQGHLLSQAENTWKLNNYATTWANTAKNSGTSALGALQPYIDKSIEQTYALESDGAVAGALLQTVTTENVYDDYGNPTDITVTTSGGGKNFQKITTNSYEAIGLDVTYSKEKGRLSETTVVSNRDEDGDGSYDGDDDSTSERTSSFTYYGPGDLHLEGLLKTETIEPNDTTLELTTTHSYDEFGNKVRAATTDADGKTRCNFNTAEYDESGRYVDINYDCLGRTVSSVEDRNEYGEPLKIKTYLDLTATNSVSTHYAYTPKGIRYLEGSDTGAWKATTLNNCSGGGSCPTGAVYYAKVTAAGGGESREYFDVLGRSILKASVGFDGQWIYANTEYDNLGRVKHKSEPYYNGSSASHWSTMTYDILGRVTHILLPDNSDGFTAYNGYTTVTTNDLTQRKDEIKNALGETIQVTNYLGSTPIHAYYRYDAQGNLEEVEDNDGNITEIKYDLLSRKESMDDPDKGYWEYKYNGFGELEEQTDAKLQKSEMTYDDLGRMETRIDKTAAGLVEGNTSWTYDDAPNGLGQLDNVEDSVSGYLKMVEYDSLGRTSKTVTSLGVSAADGDHYEKVTYDQYGRTHQVFDAARNDDTYTNNGIVTLYNQYGYQYQLADATYINDQPRSIYQEVLAMNARGQVTSEKLGNNATTARTYNDQTGRIEDILATTMLGTSGDIQNLRYEWDSVGNLGHRWENSGNKSLDEGFTYDGLNRLETYHVTGQAVKSITYDSLGNIKTKSDVGVDDYAYGTGNTNSAGDAGPHAVTSAGGTNYSYDNNGNNTSSSDASGNIERSIAYTTFDKAKTITKGAHTTTFAYGADRARYKRTDTNASGTKSTLYIGSVEKITNVDGTKQVKRTIGGVAIITLNQDNQGVTQSTDTNYLYKDHLGSLDIITDATGAIASNGGEMSFDAFGARRDAINWQDISDSIVTAGFGVFSNSGVGPVTTRGFTGHEMADEVGIIHMNGRIYDPKLARFLQADPFVDGVFNTQGYNRYSYGKNNPLNGTDPSGYGFFSKVFDDILGITESPILNGIAQVAACYFGGPTGCAAYATASAKGHGASWGQAFKAGGISYISAQAFSEIGGMDFGAHDAFIRPLAHGVVGGITAELQGGKFGHGFVSAGLTKAINANGIVGIDVDLAGLRIITAAVVGGTISELTGDKFANGAVTAAFGQLFNGEQQAARDRSVQKGQVVAGIYGAGGPKAGDNPTLEALVTDMGGQMFYANQEVKIANYLSAGVAEGKEAVLFGYSRGGNAAINVANALGKQGVRLSNLITFDAHSLLDGKTFQLKYDNVGQAYNFYQRNLRTGGRFGWWGSNPYWGSPVSSPYINVNQVNFSGANYRNDVPVSHLNIIRHSVSSF